MNCSDSQDGVVANILERLDKLEEDKQGFHKRPNKIKAEKQVECFNCHRLGHYARQYPEKLSSSREQSRQLKRSK